MSIYGRHTSIHRKHKSSYVTRTGVVSAAVAAAALALGAISAAADAQDSSGAYPSGTGQRGSDADVAARVKDALQSNSTLDSRHIEVAVEHGEVHLKGFVQDNRTLLAAGQAATKAAGDRKIVNELIIKENYAH